MITVIAGTNRKASNSLIIAKVYSRLLTQKKIENKIFDLYTIPAHFLSSDMYGVRSIETQSIIDEFIKPAHHFVFIIPEYHGSYPGIVKLFLDGVESSLFHNKNAALVGVASGRQGNSRGLDALGNVLNYMQMEVLSKKIKISGIERLIDNENLIDQATINSLEQQIDKMIDKWLIPTI